MKRLVRFALAFLLLFPTAASVAVLARLLPDLFRVSGSSEAFWWMLLGYPVVHYAVFRPVGVYIVGHEMAHAVAAWLTGHKVKSFFVGKGGGHVTLSGSNIFIALAPYCFPFYTLVVLVIYALLRWLYEIPGGDPVFCGAVGLTLAFHLVSTVDILRAAKQPDLKEAGVFLSMVLIVLSNAWAVLLVLKLLFPRKVSLPGLALQGAEYLSRWFEAAAALF